MTMASGSSLQCPLCAAAVPPTSLEAHLRWELGLALLKCALCHQLFVDDASAEAHFRGELARHPGCQPQLLHPPNDPAKTARLVELLRLARGGPEAVQQRLCVCGQCRLLCREDLQPTSDREGKGTRAAVAQDKDSGECLPSRGSTEQEPNAPLPKHLPDQRYEPHELPVAVEEEESLEQASEEAPAMPMDVKPSLGDLKPRPASDGKVSCLQCSRRIDKNGFSTHVQKVHIPGKPFQCLLCPLNTKTRSEQAKHQRAEHGAEPSAETFQSSLNKDVVKDWINLCFGEAKGVPYRGSRCGPCDKYVLSQNAKKHVSTVHLKKALHKCRLCTYEITSIDSFAMRTHVKKQHGAAPSPATVDSSAAEHYAPIVGAMITQLFEK